VRLRRSSTALTQAKESDVNVLVIDIGGTNVKIWKTGEADKLKFPSGKSLDPSGLVKQIKRLTTDWTFEAACRSTRFTWL
jgi:hypothetical protein